MKISVRDPRPLAPPGAPESPRAQPAASTKLILHRLRAVFSDAITSWLTADAQINRWMIPPGQAHSPLLVSPAPHLVPVPAHSIIRKPCPGRS